MLGIKEKWLMQLKPLMLVLLYRLVIASVAAQVNPHLIEQITGREGLSNSAVSCIIQDSLGFMWFGTWDGLNRYDGYSIVTYKPELLNPNSISNNVIRDIKMDAQGRLWMTTHQGLNMYDPSLERFHRYFFGQTITSYRPENNIFTGVNKWGQVFVAVYGWGLGIFSEEKNDFERLICLDEQDRVIHNLAGLAVTPDNDLWILSDDHIIYQVDHEQIGSMRPRARSFPVSEYLGHLERLVINAFYADKQGNIWIGTQSNGLIRFDTRPEATQPFTVFSESEAGPTMNITAIYECPEGKLWIGTNDQGVLTFQPRTGRFIPLIADNTLAERYFYNIKVRSIYADTNGILWIGTDGRGVYKIIPNRKQFIHVFRQPGTGLNHSVIRSIWEDANGNIWVGTRGGGINKLTPVGRFYRHFEVTYYENKPGIRNSLKNNEVFSIREDTNGMLWIGYDEEGFDLFDPASQTFYHFPEDFSGTSDSYFKYVYAIHFDRDGYAWLGTSGYGLIRLKVDFDPHNKRPIVKEYTQYLNDPTNPASLSHNIIYAIEQGPGHSLWIGTRGGGLNLLDVNTDRFTRFMHDPADPQSLINNDIVSLYRDSSDNLWIGTNGGLNLLPADSMSRFIYFTEKEGLPNNYIHGILEDRSGNIWLSTNNGISRYNPEAATFKNYTHNDGLQDNEFTDGAYFRSKQSGYLFFGGINGFNVFLPENISDNPFFPRVVFTDFQLFNKTVPINQAVNGRVILNRSINQTDKIRLRFSDKLFSFEFAALQFDAPEKNQYAYMLQGFDKDWYLTDSRRRYASYSNLAPGEYVFMVKASNNDLVWNEEPATVRIRIMPPWYASWWAYIIYTMLITTISFIVWRVIKMRHEYQTSLHLEKMESKKNSELNQMKLRFFTNISHEFRTPLTLILGPLDRIMENSTLDGKVGENLRIMQKNARRMLRLIKQLIDFRKVETGQMLLRASPNDVIPFLRDIVDNFKPIAEEHQIMLEFSSEYDSFHLWFDIEKLESIFYNVISNALKYTPGGGHVKVLVEKLALGNQPFDVAVDQVNSLAGEQKCLSIKVIDNGIGIPQDQLSNIFNRFYSDQRLVPRKEHFLQESSGIGLALTKALVELHGGTIVVESTLNKGSIFTIDLPCGKDWLRENQIIQPGQEGDIPHAGELSGDEVGFIEEAIDTDQPENPDLNKPLILIAEDNKELRTFIRNNLHEKYSVIEAPNGEVAFQKAVTLLPDLIISDIMMPEMDGLELTKRIKTDEKTNHVPVILLTAKSTVEDRIEGIGMGADSYIPKPFYFRHLEVRIEKLIHLRETLRKKYSLPDDGSESEDSPHNKFEQEFLERADSLIEEHMTDPDFSVDKLGSGLAYSRMQLYRKIKALTGLSPVEYIRRYRLIRSAALMKEGYTSIKEILYAVGFNNRSYFYKSFKSHFGISPREYLTRIGKKQKAGS
jgi:signal transduction histidine kinase/ligand-binding sensor domain-containing protein/AraC-like DNA-binding protein/ActR/RegA family two-component response regulator